MEAPTLRSRRLVMTPVGPTDLRDIAALHADSRVARLLVDGIPDTEERAAIFVAWNAPFRAAGMGTWAARRIGEPGLVGLYSLAPFDPDPSLMEFGGKLAPAHWRGGLAAEGARAVIAYAFSGSEDGGLGRDRLVSAFDPANRSAAATLGRLGFVADGAGELFGRAVTRMTLRRPDHSAG